MHSIVDDLFERASEFMHKSGLHMHDDFVGKSHDLYLWSFICESKSASVWGCPMRFTTGCCAGIRITEKGKYLSLEFCGSHHPGCHEINGRSPGVTGFRPYLSSECASDEVGSGKLDKYGVIFGHLSDFSAQMDSTVRFAWLPPKLRQLLSVNQFRQLQSLLSCVDRRSSDARSAALNLVTPCLILIPRPLSTAVHASWVSVCGYCLRILLFSLKYRIFCLRRQ